MTSSSAPATARRVQHRDVPAQQMLCAVQRLKPQHLTRFVNGATLALPSILTEQAATQLGPVMVIYHQPITQESDGPVEICVPYSGELSVPEGLVTRLDPPHREAYLPMTKAQFRDSGLFNAARRELEAYARANGEATGPLRQIDFGVWEIRQEGNMVGEIALPMKWVNQLRPETRGRLFP